jgi:hypothetical protein
VRRELNDADNTGSNTALRSPVALCYVVPDRLRATSRHSRRSGISCGPLRTTLEFSATWPCDSSAQSGKSGRRSCMNGTTTESPPKDISRKVLACSDGIHKMRQKKRTQRFCARTLAGALDFLRTSDPRCKLGACISESPASR